MSAAPQPELADDESLVDLRCSVVVIRGHDFLLIERGQTDDWVLPGGRPRPGESLQSCARREALEETGLAVNPTRCAFVAEVIDPEDGARVVEMIFLASLDHSDHQSPVVGEPGNRPAWVNLRDLRTLHLSPPIAGYLPALARGGRSLPPTAPYLGNLWRSTREARTPPAGAP